MSSIELPGLRSPGGSGRSKSRAAVGDGNRLRFRAMMIAFQLVEAAIIIEWGRLLWWAANALLRP